MQFFSKKMLKFVVKILKKNSITSRKNTVTYHKTLEEATWLLRLDKPENRQKFSKTLKKSFSKNLKNSQSWNVEIILLPLKTV